MCTCISYISKDHYFGRNLDLEYSLNESVIITPRNYPMRFRHMPTPDKRFAMIGIGIIEDGYPLYYDAVNEYGLGIAGLNFPGNAIYHNLNNDCANITPFELIPWVLVQCKSVKEAVVLLSDLNLLDEPFNDRFRLTPLHWMISDRADCVVVEPLRNGIQIIKNPVRVLTNNPTFDFHMLNLCQFINLTSDEPFNRFSNKTELLPFSRGMGAIGLPGDLSSASRFVRAAFTKLNSIDSSKKEFAVSQCFHILDVVKQVEGCVRVGEKYEKTVYSSCCNAERGIYYYCTYNNRQITAVDLRRENLEGVLLRRYPLIIKQNIHYEN